MNNYSKTKLLIIGAVAPLAIYLSCQQYTSQQQLERVDGTLRLLISVSTMLDSVGNHRNKK